MSKLRATGADLFQSRAKKAPKETPAGVQPPLGVLVPDDGRKLRVHLYLYPEHVAALQEAARELSTFPTPLIPQQILEFFIAQTAKDEPLLVHIQEAVRRLPPRLKSQAQDTTLLISARAAQWLTKEVAPDKTAATAITLFFRWLGEDWPWLRSRVQPLLNPSTR